MSRRMRRGARRGSRSLLPGSEELGQVGLSRGAQQRLHALDLLGMPRAGDESAQLRKAQVDEPGVEHVGLAIAPDALEVAALPRLPDLAAIEAELARQPEQARHVGERHLTAALEARQHVHEIRMPPVIAAEVVVRSENRSVREEWTS